MILWLEVKVGLGFSVLSLASYVTLSCLDINFLTYKVDSYEGHRSPVGKQALYRANCDEKSTAIRDPTSSSSASDIYYVCNLLKVI